MRGKMIFVAGLAAGYVLGAKAGRERYEQIMRAARKLRENPNFQEAAGFVQAQATQLVSEGRDLAAEKLGHTRLAHTKIGERLLGDRHPDPTPAAPAKMP